MLEANAANAGVGLDTVGTAMKELNFITGETDSNVEALSNLLAAGFDEATLPQVVESLAGAVIKFPDTLKIESLADSPAGNHCNRQIHRAVCRNAGPVGHKRRRI